MFHHWGNLLKKKKFETEAPWKIRYSWICFVGENPDQMIGQDRVVIFPCGTQKSSLQEKEKVYRV